MHKLIGTVVFAALALGAFAGGALAQDRTRDRGYFASEDPDAAPASEGRVYAYTPPRVFGWVSRPASCGTFRYWNGLRCVDKRFEPLE